MPSLYSTIFLVFFPLLFFIFFSLYTIFLPLSSFFWKSDIFFAASHLCCFWFSIQMFKTILTVKMKERPRRNQKYEMSFEIQFFFLCDDEFKLNASEVPLGRCRYVFCEKQRNYGTWTQWIWLSRVYACHKARTMLTLNDMLEPPVKFCLVLWVCVCGISCVLIHSNTWCLRQFGKLVIKGLEYGHSDIRISWTALCNVHIC